MSTTYGRLNVILREIEQNVSGNNIIDIDPFVESIVERQIPELTLNRMDPETGERTPHSLSEHTLRKYIYLLEDFDFVDLNGDHLTITDRGVLALDEDRYPRSIAVATYSLLSDYGVTREVLFDAMDSVEPPNLPGSEEIYRNLNEDVNKEVLDIELFRRLLYLLACAGSIQREVSVYYAR